MKTWMYLFLILALAACQNNNETPASPGQKEKTYTLSFQLGGELSEMSQEFTTRAEVKTNRDLYWMEIWYSDKDKDNFNFYGRGVFDNPDSIKVEFKDGYKYRIQMSYVKEGKNKIWKDIVTGKYGAPIADYYFASGIYCCDNQSVIITLRDVFRTTTQYHHIQDEGNNSHGSFSELTGRYYGRVDNFIPEENSRIALDLYKVSYGIQICVNGLTDGKLDIHYSDGRDDGYGVAMDRHFIFDAAAGKTQQKKHEELQWAWDINGIASIMNNPTGERVVLSKQRFYVKWTNGNGLVTLDLGSKEFWLERNKMNIITVNLSQLPSVDNGASFTFETIPMTEKESGSLEGSIE